MTTRDPPDDGKPCPHGNHPDMCLDPGCRTTSLVAWGQLTPGGIEGLIAAARAHGEQSEPEHEVGDLQNLLLDCWRVMSPAQRRDVFEAHRDLLEWRSDES